jgi:hypothetical protein
MSRRAVSRLAWSLWALSLASAVASVVFRVLNSSAPTAAPQEAPVFLIWGMLIFVSFATVGALVASRQPENAIGWIFCALGLLFPLTFASEGYAVYALATRTNPLPGGESMLWLAGLLGGPSNFALIALILLLFPDGKPLSRRWRPAVWVALIAIVLLSSAAFIPGPIENVVVPAVVNPYGIVGADTLLNALTGCGFFMTLAAAVAGAVSLVLRLRRSRGDERQQLKWFVFAGAVCCAALPAGPILWSIPASSGFGWAWPVLFLSAVSTIPAAAGIAILRYRLYDIDLLINRTLVYGALTAMLALVYVSGVVSLQYVLRVLTGQGSQLAIVASTLAIAALFSPLRRGIQGAVDRRFYRRKYDATKTLEAFSSRLRNETELDALSDDLLSVVRETVQPEYVSLWLRNGGRSG